MLNKSYTTDESFHRKKGNSSKRKKFFRKGKILKPPTLKRERIAYFDLVILSYKSNKRFNRAGIIPYTTHPITGKLTLLLGIDYKSGDISDLAGSVKNEIGERSTAAAVREFEEESRYIFKEGERLEEAIMWCTCFIYRKSITIFVPIKEEWVIQAPKLFDESIITETMTRDEEEMSEMLWIDWDIFLKLIDGGRYRRHKLWGKVRKIMGDSIDMGLESRLRNHLYPTIF